MILSIQVYGVLGFWGLRPQILKYIMWLSYQKPQIRKPERRVYADEQEYQAMEVCRPYCIDHLHTFLEALPGRQLFRAMDVAGGDGSFAINFLINQYQRVDLFDACSLAVFRANDRLSGF